MPREDTMEHEAPVTTPRRRQQDLLELVGRTPGFDVDPYNGGWRVTGGTKPLIVPSNLTDDEIDDLEAALAHEGWSRQAAEEHIAQVTALYEQAVARIPEGGYPKQNRVITRADARLMLAFLDACGCNTRPPRKSKILEYTDSMNRGKWRPYSPQGLVLSLEHGCALDGRQRLMALLKSALSEMGFSITYDVPIEEFKYLDQGANRSAADILAGEGYDPGVRNKVGSAVKLAMGYDSGLPWKKWRDMIIPAHRVSDELAGAYADMRGKPYNDAITLGWNKRDSTGCKMLPAVGAALSFLIRRDCPDGPWEDFRTALVYGSNLSQSDPRLTLRNQMINRNTSKPHRYEQYLQLGAALVAWELWMNDLPASQITFRDGMKMPRIWVPGMPLSGKDANWKAKQRVERDEQRRAAARAAGSQEEG